MQGFFYTGEKKTGVPVFSLITTRHNGGIDFLRPNRYNKEKVKSHSYQFPAGALPG